MSFLNHIRRVRTQHTPDQMQARCQRTPAKNSFATVLLAIALMGSSGCQQDQSPATFSILIPEANKIQTTIGLTKRYGIGLSGNFDIMQYGSVFLEAETPEHPFRFGFTLNTGVFLRDTWVNYSEVTSLPTGDAFPSWQSGGVVDVVIPPINTNVVDWHFYFGTRGKLYVGVAGLIHAINQNFPSLRIEYSFYDSQGRVILGLVFFGPKVLNGQLEVPGGIYVGTNITPFIPADVLRAVDPNQQAASSGMAMLSSLNVTELARQGAAGRPVSINGQSAIADIKLVGPDASRYRTNAQVQGLINRFMAVSKTR